MATLTEALVFSDDYLRKVIHVRSSDPDALVGVHRLLRDASTALDGVIDECLTSALAGLDDGEIQP